jgi:hypothetical protein
MGACCAAAILSVNPHEPLPGVALGSDLVLAAERATALFAGWMLVLVVVSRALAGELPLEITSRGFRYAEAETTRRTTAQLERSVEDLEADLAEMRRLNLRESSPEPGESESDSIYTK